MKVGDWMYIFSLGLQLAGALVLLFSNLTKKSANEVVEEERPKGVYAASEEEALSKIADEMKKRYISKYTEMYKNVFAFAYLFIGYLISIWATDEYKNKFIIAGMVVILCVGLCVIVNIVAKKIGIREAGKKAFTTFPEGCMWCELETENTQKDESIEVCEEADGREEIDEEVDNKNEVKNEDKKTADEKKDAGKLIKVVATIVPLLAPIYVIIREICNILFKNECEDFYGIPQAYFSSDFKLEILYFVVSILGIVFIVYPAIARILIERNQEEKKKSVEIFWGIFSVIYGVCYGFLNVANARDIPYVWKFVSKYEVLCALCEWALFSFGIVAVLGLTFSLELSNKEGQWKKIRKIGYIFCISATTITMGLQVIKIGYSLDNRSIKDKTEYEFVVGAEKEYVVLSEKDDTILVVEYDINSDGKYVFYTGEYEFLERKDYKYFYEDIGSEPERKHEKKVKREYEIVLNAEKDYVVISEHNDNVMVVEYEIDEEGHYVLYMGKYEFLERSEYMYRRVNIGEELIIKEEARLGEVAE